MYGNIFIIFDKKKSLPMKNSSAAILIICCSFGGCLSLDETTEYRVDGELINYVDSFFNYAEQNGEMLSKENLIVQLKTGLEDSGDWGLSTHKGSQRIVFIDKDYFDFYLKTNHPDRIETLVLHELGHALLYRKHSQKYSIMNLSNPAGYKNESDKKSLISELFKP